MTEPILAARGVRKTSRTGTQEVEALRGIDRTVRDAVRLNPRTFRSFLAPR